MEKSSSRYFRNDANVFASNHILAASRFLRDVEPETSMVLLELAQTLLRDVPDAEYDDIDNAVEMICEAVNENE